MDQGAIRGALTAERGREEALPAPMRSPFSPPRHYRGEARRAPIATGSRLRRAVAVKAAIWRRRELMPRRQRTRTVNSLNGETAGIYIYIIGIRGAREAGKTRRSRDDLKSEESRHRHPRSRNSRFSFSFLVLSSPRSSP